MGRRRRIALSPRAFDDLEAQFNYISADNPDAARRFLDAAYATFQRIAEGPNIGALRASGMSRLAGIRRWRIKGFTNYLVFYRTTEEAVRILRILHGSRDIDVILLTENEEP